LNFFEVNDIYKLVIKYCKLIFIFNYKNNLLKKINIEALKHGYQKGLGTLLVYAINYEYKFFYYINVKNTPPGQYSRKVET